jgi:putative OPT family oligopeptide transporter
VGGSVAYFGSNLSPALLSVGYIVGINIAVLIFLGGAANWLVTIPICASMSEWAVYPDSHELAGQAMSAVDFAGEIWSTKTRYIGVGGMLIGGLWTVFHLRKSLLSGITSGLKAYRNLPHEKVTIERTDKDIPMKWVLILIIASVVPMFLVYMYFVEDVQISLVMAVIMVLAGFLFAAVAGYMAGLVGSSNNPISGVTIATVLVSAIILFFLMRNGPEELLKKGPAFAVIIGSVVCCAAAISGDVMQDLKCGRLVGTTPWKQQVMELIGTVAAALVIPLVLMLLHEAYGFKGMEGASESALSAPQAGLMSSVAQGVFGGDLPKVFIYMGMGIAVAIIALDTYLQKIKCPFRTPVLAVAIGFYLPFELSVPIFAGGLIAVAVKAYQKRRRFAEHDIEASDRKGLLFASGLITGEALIGILMAIPIIICKRFEIETPILGWWDAVWGKWLGLILIVGAALWLYATASKPNGIKNEIVD